MSNVHVLNINICKPLGVDKKIHPAEKEQKNDGSTDALGDERGPSLDVNGIGVFMEDTDHHVEYTEDNRHLHFDSVSKW